MQTISQILLSILMLFLSAPILTAAAQALEKRIALVIGNADYQAVPLQTPANDAGLIAQTLQAAGFDVAGARDLDQDSLRRALRGFLEQASASGPDTIAYVYVSGYGLQLEGENYIIPIDARIARDIDVPVEALRVSDYLRPLAALKLRASIVVLDLARPNPFARSGPPLAGGLALVEPEPGMLVAFNASPGTVAPSGPGPYGTYAHALAEMIREGGLELGDVFDRTRLRVSDVTGGAQVPWHLSNVQSPFFFFDRAPDAPPPLVSPQQAAALRLRPLYNFDAQDAYGAALDRDTLQAYEEFLATYPSDPMAARVRALAAARREAITWRRTRLANTPFAYWSYLRRYPRGPHVADARRRLSFLAAALEPPPSFPLMPFEVAPPPPEEEFYVARPSLAFDDPDLGLSPPPPIFVLPPPPPEFVVLVPPAPPIELYALPDPIFVPFPIWVRPPAHVVAPPRNLIFTNIHNTRIINNTTIIDSRGRPDAVSPTGGGRLGFAPVAAVAAAVALPPFLAQRATQIQNQSPQSVLQRQDLLQQRLQQHGALQQQQQQLTEQHRQQRLQQQQQHRRLLEQQREQAQPQPQQQVLEQQRRQQQQLLEQQRQQQEQLLGQQRQFQQQQQEQMLEQQRQHQQQIRRLEQQRLQQQRQLDQQQQQRQLEQQQRQQEQRRQLELQRLQDQQQRELEHREFQRQQEQQRHLEQQRLQQQRQLEQQQQFQRQQEQQRQLDQQRLQQQQQRGQQQCGRPGLPVCR